MGKTEKIKPTDKTLAAARSFAKGHDEVKFERVYGEELAYYVHDKADDGCCVGYPLYVLVDAALHCRWADADESLDIMH